MRRSEDGSYFSYSFGLTSNIPTLADYDSDGITDTATFRPSTATWYIINSGNSTYSILTFGLDGDKPVPADYDGDGKADIATWRAARGGSSEVLILCSAATVPVRLLINQLSAAITPATAKRILPFIEHRRANDIS